MYYMLQVRKLSCCAFAVYICFEFLKTETRRSGIVHLYRPSIGWTQKSHLGDLAFDHFYTDGIVFKPVDISDAWSRKDNTGYVCENRE
jgi:hypothetical protein